MKWPLLTANKYSSDLNQAANQKGLLRTDNFVCRTTKTPLPVIGSWQVGKAILAFTVCDISCFCINVKKKHLRTSE